LCSLMDGQELEQILWNHSNQRTDYWLNYHIYWLKFLLSNGIISDDTIVVLLEFNIQTDVNVLDCATSNIAVLCQSFFQVQILVTALSGEPSLLVG